MLKFIVTFCDHIDTQILYNYFKSHVSFIAEFKKLNSLCKQFEIVFKILLFEEAASVVVLQVLWQYICSLSLSKFCRFR